MTFEAWKHEVNRRVEKLTGFSCDDLPDEDYWVAWQEDTTPTEMALDVARTNGYSDDE